MGMAYDEVVSVLRQYTCDCMHRREKGSTLLLYKGAGLDAVEGRADS